MKSHDHNAKIETSNITRDALHNLDLSKTWNEQIFKQYLVNFIACHEDVRATSYEDSVGKVTVGIGFNMDRPGAREEWDAVFGGKVSFDEVYNQKLNMTRDQIEMLAIHSIDIRTRELKRIYGSNWERLRANERIAIISAYYNCPAFVRGGTNFKKHMQEYLKTGEKKHLLSAVDELGARSNPSGNKGLLSRRKCEAELLDSTKAPFYAPPGSPVVPSDPIKVIIGQTIVPIGLSDHFPVSEDSDYFVWRTKLDEKVRDKHKSLEGKVYKKLNPPDGQYPGDDYGCRCYAEPLTTNIIVTDNSTELKSFRDFIRYPGGAYATIII